MSATEILEKIRLLTEAERRELVEAIEVEFGCAGGGLFTGEAALIESRLRDHLENPEDVVPLEKVKSRLDTKYGK
jgi:putative addiction module component (TIGR02574 family)